VRVPAEFVAGMRSEPMWPLLEAVAHTIPYDDAIMELLPGEHIGKYPHQLSGGQKQRVGVARALAGDPGILLMDEPFGALDPITRGQLHDEFAKLQRRFKKTVVFVTHDMLEAIRLADRMAILDDGRLLQVGTAREILTCPESSKVADLVGVDATLRLLGLSAVAHAMETSVAEPEPLGGSPVRATDSLKDALVAMVAAGRPVLSVVDDNGVVRGRVTLSGMLLRRQRVGTTCAGRQ
jgi:osmoprotectant transport system ATP-binding protein